MKATNNKQTYTAKTDPVNVEVLNRLRKYAQFYFSKIVELNNADGEVLRAGEYTAEEMTDNSYKSVFGRAYRLPEDEIFDANITITVGDFQCEIVFRQIFNILAKWEKMMKIGKDKTIFKIGESCTTTAKVVTSKRDNKGGYKTKSMTLQHITGNWYMPTRFKSNAEVQLIYKLGDIYFQPGKSYYGDTLNSDRKEDKESVLSFCGKYDDEFIATTLQTILDRDNDNIDAYFAYIAKLAGMSKQIPTQDTTDNEQTGCTDTSTQTAQTSQTPTPPQTANNGDLGQSTLQVSNIPPIPPKCVTSHYNSQQTQCNDAA